ncbi:MAG: M6 family metalloprotease domain-containing protein [bacterium]
MITRTASVAAVLALVLAAIAATAAAITARPGGPATLGAAGTPYYFAARPAIVDLPESPARTRSLGRCTPLVILMDFPDRVGRRDVNTPAYFAWALFGPEAGTLSAYFGEASYGKFTLAADVGDVAGWYRSSCLHAAIVNRDGVAGTKDDYGLDISSDALNPAVCEFPLNIWGLVRHAVQKAAEDLDLAQYDNDGPDGVPDSGDDDGSVDALIVVHAGVGAETIGYGSEGANHIWSLQSSLDYYTPTRNTILDNTRVGAFILVPELGEIGVYAHEFGHLLGLPDLYNTITGESIVGTLCLMDQGAWLGPFGNGSVPCHPSSVMKYLLGWIDPEKVCLGCDGGVPARPGAEIEALGANPSAYIVLDNPGGMDWTAGGQGIGEYFLLENRQPIGQTFEEYLPGSGMLVWRINEARPDNNTAGQRLAEVIQADGGSGGSGTGSETPGEASDFWPGTLGKTEFGPYTSPSSTLSGNRYSGAAAASITESAGLVRADIEVGLPQRGRTYAYPSPQSIESFRAGTPVRIVFNPEIGAARPYAFDVTIFDLEGKPVRRLSAADPGETLPEGVGLWDGKDEDGHLVEPGLYFYVARSSGQEATGMAAVKR